jgi:hypothetical protein
LPITNELTTALTIITAMLTPAVLILACASLSISTSNRVSRVIGRTREVSRLFEEIAQTPGGKVLIDEERAELFRQVSRATRRSHLLQRSLSYLYMAIGLFVATSLAIGVVAITGQSFAWLPIGLGLAGGTALLYTTVLLIIESRVAVDAVDDEMEFILRLAELRARQGPAKTP